MSRYSLVTALILLLLASVACAGGGSEDKNITNVYFIDSSQFHGFEKCRRSRKLDETVNRLMTNGKPANKEESSWTYLIKADVFGLPARALQIGVCDVSGERACGWGGFLAVVIAKPLEEVKRHLKKKFGTDFTKEKERKNLTSRYALSWSKVTSPMNAFSSAIPEVYNRFLGRPRRRAHKRAHKGQLSIFHFQ